MISMVVQMVMPSALRRPPRARRARRWSAGRQGVMMAMVMLMMATLMMRMMVMMMASGRAASIGIAAMSSDTDSDVAEDPWAILLSGPPDAQGVLLDTPESLEAEGGRSSSQAIRRGGGLRRLWILSEDDNLRVGVAHLGRSLEAPPQMPMAMPMEEGAHAAEERAIRRLAIAAAMAGWPPETQGVILSFLG